MPVYEVSGSRDSVRDLVERAVAVDGWPVEARDAALFAWGRPEERERGVWQVQVSMDATSGSAQSRVRRVGVEPVVQDEAPRGAREAERVEGEFAAIAAANEGVSGQEAV